MLEFIINSLNTFESYNVICYVNYITEYLILSFSLNDRQKLLVSLNLSFRIVCKIFQ